MMMTAVTGHARDRGLLGQPDLTDVAMLAARSAAGARRVMSEEALDDIDRVSLEGLRDLLSSFAEAITYFGTGGAQGAQSGALAATVEATIRAVAQPAMDPGKALRRSADLIRDLLEQPTTAVAAAVAELASGLAVAAGRETGHPGENTSRL